MRWDWMQVPTYSAQNIIEKMDFDQMSNVNYDRYLGGRGGLWKPEIFWQGERGLPNFWLQKKILFATKWYPFFMYKHQKEISKLWDHYLIGNKDVFHNQMRSHMIL